MAWPTVVVDTTNMDAAGDNPGNARAAIKQMADNVNAIKDSKGAASGVAELDAGGKVPVGQVPTIPANQGGTGKTVFAVGDLLVADTTSTLKRLASGAATHVLTSNGPGTEPTYQAPSNVVPDASDTVKGIVELATSAEAIAGTDTTRAVTPSGLAAGINAAPATILLGTLTTTSGTTQTLSGLNLTSYKQLFIVVNGVSMAANALLGNLRTNGYNISHQIAAAGTNLCWGTVIVDLGSSIATSIIDAGASFTSFSPVGANAVNIVNSGLTTSSTSISFTFSNGAAFDAGSIKVYGVK